MRKWASTHRTYEGGTTSLPQDETLAGGYHEASAHLGFQEDKSQQVLLDGAFLHFHTSSKGAE